MLTATLTLLALTALYAAVRYEPAPAPTTMHTSLSGLSAARRRDLARLLDDLRAGTISRTDAACVLSNGFGFCGRDAWQLVNA